MRHPHRFVLRAEAYGTPPQNEVVRFSVFRSRCKNASTIKVPLDQGRAEGGSDIQS